MEGQDPMTGTILVSWQVAPLSPPQVLRHCSTCGRSRPFGSSGKVRLNANGRRLDAWLIYKCSTCDRTWNLPLLDRVSVAEVPPADLAAMQSSDPAWVQARAFDLTALRRHALQILLPADLTVTKGPPDPVTAGWTRIALTLHAPCPVGQRLDQLLAQELGLSRSLIQSLQATGGLAVAMGPRSALKSPLAGTVVLHFDAHRIGDSVRLGLARAFGLPPPGAGA
jgi:hypothetical protein